MLQTNNPIIKHKAGLFNLAQELNNILRACKVMGVSRDTFYRCQELVNEGGVEALIDKSRRSPNLKNRIVSIKSRQPQMKGANCFAFHHSVRVAHADSPVSSRQPFEWALRVAG